MIYLILVRKTIKTVNAKVWNLNRGAFDWEIRISNFAIEREIQKRISLSRNPSSLWISKSKSGFHGFPFYRSIGKFKKGFAKLFSWTVVFFLLIMRARARPLFLRTVFQILFPISQNKGKKGNPRSYISALKSVIGFRVPLQIRILKSKSRFPNRTHSGSNLARYECVNFLRKREFYLMFDEAALT